mmetsp:Transcript_4999/g.16240  ORF Transcript_4999/g.16240 Transcript_4999/m.16240 type:complete len:212 (+) Transcript_4999:28-663(+)
MISSRRAGPGGRRATFCYVKVPRSDRRHAPGEAHPHIAYLIRVHSDLGTFPSERTWYELRFSRIAKLHAELAELHPELQLPGLPRTRWFANRHPSYVAEICSDLERYFMQLLASWCRQYESYDGFLMLLDAAHHGLATPAPADGQPRHGPDKHLEGAAESPPAQAPPPPPPAVVAAEAGAGVGVGGASASLGSSSREPGRLADLSYTAFLR